MGKYNCPIKFQIKECAYAWTMIECDFNGKVLSFNVSQSSGADQISDFVDGLLLLCDASYVSMHYEKHETKNDVWVDGIPWDDVGVSVNFLWDEEPSYNKWKITRKSFESFSDYSFPTEVNIQCFNGNKEGTYVFDVNFKDLCYALAKCLTDTLKQYGFEGYCNNTYGESIDIRKLLLLKRYALGMEITSNRIDDSYYSNFAEEIELLLRDM